MVTIWIVSSIPLAAIAGKILKRTSQDDPYEIAHGDRPVMPTELFRIPARPLPRVAAEDCAGGCDGSAASRAFYDDGDGFETLIPQVFHADKLARKDR